MSEIIYATQSGTMDFVSVVRVEGGRSVVMCDLVSRGGSKSSYDLAEMLCALLTEADKVKTR